MADYTAWPAVHDIQTRAQHYGVDLNKAGRGVSGADVRKCVDAVSAYVTRFTRRTFTPGEVGEVRYYNGSGTGEIEIDDVISVSEVSVVGYVPTSTSLTLDAVYTRRDTNYAPTFLVIRQGGFPAWGYFAGFPAGRQNIAVTAQFGFEEIPEDLWDAVEGEVVARLGDRLNWTPEGRLKSLEQGGIKETYDLLHMSDADGATSLFKTVALAYKKTTARRLRQVRPVMI